MMTPKTTMNPPLQSKINLTALVLQIIGVIAAFDLIPPAAEEHFMEISIILVPALIQVWRTWYTEVKT